MVCSKCIKGAPVCPKGTTEKQYSKYSMTGSAIASSSSSKNLNFKKRPAAFGCSLQFYKYRYFVDMCREIPVEAKQEKQMKTRFNIAGGLHPYQSEASIIVD